MEKISSDQEKELKEIQDKINLKNSQFREKLSVEEKKKADVISAACKMLEQEGISFWLHAEQAVEIQDGEKEDRYVQYNWCPKVWGNDGSLSEAGKDFVINHIRSLFYGTYGIIVSSLIDTGKEVTWENIFGVFHAEIDSYYKFHGAIK
jgi:hypothetical protein